MSEYERTANEYQAAALDCVQALEDYNQAIKEATAHWRWHDWLVWYLFYWWR